MLPSSEIRKIGSRKMADRPSTATLNSAPGKCQGRFDGLTFAVTQNRATPTIPTPLLGDRQQDGDSHCPAIEVPTQQQAGNAADCGSESNGHKHEPFGHRVAPGSTAKAGTIRTSNIDHADSGR